MNIGIVGATGYAGQNLAWLVLNHPRTTLSFVTSRSCKEQPYTDIAPNLKGAMDLVCLDSEALDAGLVKETDLVFLALPHGSSMAKAGELMEMNPDLKIVDLSADFRLHDPAVYEKWYRLPHMLPHLLQTFAYGLPELHGPAIRKATYVANPGCYPTASILALAPAFEKDLVEADVVVDAKSGVSGAGRSAKTANLFCEVNESVKAYGLFSHRHTPEIAQELGLLGKTAADVVFTPHLVPMNRGILATCYARLKPGVTERDLRSAYGDFYAETPFVRFLEAGILPETRHVRQSNFCDVGIAVDEASGRLIAAAAIDNLMKGAASQAVQNMNLMAGFEETAGLDFTAMAP